MLLGHICEHISVSEKNASISLRSWLDQHSELSPLFADFRQSFRELSQLPPYVLSLCKIRMSQLHSNTIVNDGEELTEEMVKAVSQWPESALFTDDEKACLEFTEMYALDVHAITDAQADAVKQYFGEPGLVALVQALGVFYAETRLGKLWGFADRLDQPEHSQ